MKWMVMFFVFSFSVYAEPLGRAYYREGNAEAEIEQYMADVQELAGDVRVVFVDSRWMFGKPGDREAAWPLIWYILQTSRQKWIMLTACQNPKALFRDGATCLPYTIGYWPLTRALMQRIDLEIP